MICEAFDEASSSCLPLFCFFTTFLCRSTWSANSRV